MNIKYAIRQKLTIIDIDGTQYIGTTSFKLTNALNRHNLKYILANTKELSKDKYLNMSNFKTIDTKTIKHKPLNINN